MTKEKWIALAITVVAVIGSLGLIKIYPFWVTLSCLISFVLGASASYFYKKIKPETTVDTTVKTSQVKSTKASKASKKTA